MDIDSIVGLILAAGLIIASIMLGEAPFTAFLDLPVSPCPPAALDLATAPQEVNAV